MDKKTALLLTAVGIITGCAALSIKRHHDIKKARALRASLRPNFRNGCHLVKIIGGPGWSLGEYGTFDAQENRILIEGEEFNAEEFEFVLA
ncbi:MAG: hypothetical protein PHD76_07330 [Methylacidiphilales bacterium]|nr:hypothetical protein [Candidatus Methylacidiphilales bacterium]